MTDKDQKSPPKTLTPVVFHMLLTLSRGALHGYAISRAVEEESDGRVRMGPGTLYGTLQRLQEIGWVEECEAAKDGAPHAKRRRYYDLTEAGLEALRSEAQRLEQIVDLAAFRALLDRR
ncbi:MAG: helix-turn-helix transcriptional regulator [Acidobacteriota bacterium]